MEWTQPFSLSLELGRGECISVTQSIPLASWYNTPVAPLGNTSSKLVALEIQHSKKQTIFENKRFLRSVTHSHMLEIFQATQIQKATEKHAMCRLFCLFPIFHVTCYQLICHRDQLSSLINFLLRVLNHNLYLTLITNSLKHYLHFFFHFLLPSPLCL